MGFVLVNILISCGKKNGEPAGKVGNKGPAKVGILVVNVKPFDHFYSFPASILAFEKVEIASEIAGRIAAIHFSEGEIVDKGRLLIKLNDDELQAQLRKLEQQLFLAKQDLNRKQKLLEIEGVSKDEVEQAEANYNILLAEKDLLSAQIRKTEICAPFRGRIGLRNISVGAWISAGQQLAGLFQVAPLKIEFNIPDHLVPLIKAGGELDFSIPGHSVTGKAVIQAKDAMIDPGTRSQKVIARIKDGNTEALPGMIAEVKLNPEPGKKSLLIPTSCLIPVMNAEKVFVMKMGKATPVFVKTGTRTAIEVEILEGLVPGDSLIVRGIMQLKPGMPVVEAGKK
jgi:membrane fusion protein (multidrug efflux system)